MVDIEFFPLVRLKVQCSREDNREEYWAGSRDTGATAKRACTTSNVVGSCLANSKGHHPFQGLTNFFSTKMLQISNGVRDKIGIDVQTGEK